MTDIPFKSFSAFRVPPIQFNSFVGNPPRLITSDMMSGCGPIVLPDVLANITHLLMSGAAYVESIANSAVNQINAAVGTVTGQLNAMIAEASGATQAALQSLVASVGGTGIAALQAQVAGIVADMPSMASLIASAGNVHVALGLPPLPSLNSIFAPIVGGGINMIMAGASAAMINIQATVAMGAEAVAAAASSLATAFTSAVAAAVAPVTAAVAGITSAVTGALATLTHLASAAALSIVCAGVSELNSFVNSIASPALQAALPPPV